MPHQSKARPSTHSNSRPIPSTKSASHRVPPGSAVQQDVEFVDVAKLKENDTLIVLMGPTGAGKTSFISKAANRDIGIGQNLQRQTRDVRTLRISVPGENGDIVLVDTPGFGDTEKDSDSEILRIISDWLEETHVKNLRLDGVLYLHRISDNRMTGAPLRYLKLFERICGPEWFSRVILVTTMWDEPLNPGEGELREKELCNNYWKGMIRLGSRTVRYGNSHESAWKILKSVRDDSRKPPEADLGRPKAGASQGFLRSLGRKLKNIFSS